MGDSVPLLKSIGRTSLLTAEQEVAWPSGRGRLFAEHSWGPWSRSSVDAFRVTLSLVAEDGRARKAHMLEANLRLVVR